MIKSPRTEVNYLLQPTFSSFSLIFFRNLEEKYYELQQTQIEPSYPPYASLTTFYNLKRGDQVPGEICVWYEAHDVQDTRIVLFINSRELKKVKDAEDGHGCERYDTFDPIKVIYRSTENT